MVKVRVAAVLRAGWWETRRQVEVSWTDPQLAAMTSHLVGDGLDYGPIRPRLD